MNEQELITPEISREGLAALLERYVLGMFEVMGICAVSICKMSGYDSYKRLLSM